MTIQLGQEFVYTEIYREMYQKKSSLRRRVLLGKEFIYTRKCHGKVQKSDVTRGVLSHQGGLSLGVVSHQR